MGLAFVQKAEGATFLASTLTITWPATPTQNDLLVITMFTRDASTTNPSGYTTDIEIVNATEDDRSRIMSKIAGSSESNPQWTGLTIADGSGMAAGILEFSGNATASFVDKTASTGRAAGVIQLSAGNTGTLTQADEVAVAVVAHRANIGSPSWDSSFTLANNPNDGASAPAEIADGYLIVAATTALAPTQSWTTSDTVIGAIVTYK